MIEPHPPPPSSSSSSRQRPPPTPPNQQQQQQQSSSSVVHRPRSHLHLPLPPTSFRKSSGSSGSRPTSSTPVASSTPTPNAATPNAAITAASATVKSLTTTPVNHRTDTTTLLGLPSTQRHTITLTPTAANSCNSNSGFMTPRQSARSTTSMHLQNLSPLTKLPLPPPTLMMNHHHHHHNNTTSTSTTSTSSNTKNYSVQAGNTTSSSSINLMAVSSSSSSSSSLKPHPLVFQSNHPSTPTTTNIAAAAATATPDQVPMQYHHYPQNNDNNCIIEEDPTTKENTTTAATEEEDIIVKEYPLPSSSSVLPNGWMELLDPTSGISYYMNEMDGTTTWDRPSLLVVPPPTTAMEENGTDDTIAPLANSVEAERQAPPSENENENIAAQDEETTPSSSVLLPTGWIELYDETTGVPYYLHESNGVTTWERPTTSTTEWVEGEVVTKDDDDDQYTNTSTDQPPSHLEQETGELKVTLAAAAAAATMELSNNKELLPPMLSSEHMEPGCEAAASFALPPGWIELYDDDSDVPYYMNEMNGTTTWDRPMPPVSFTSTTTILTEPKTTDRDEPTRLIHVAELQEPEYDVDDTNKHVVVNEPTIDENNTHPSILADDTPLPPYEDAPTTNTTRTETLQRSCLPDGWMELFDADSGLPYYMNELDGTTSWDPPPTLNHDNDTLLSTTVNPPVPLSLPEQEQHEDDDVIDNGVSDDTDDAMTNLSNDEPLQRDAIEPDTEEIVNDESAFENSLNGGETLKKNLPDGWIELLDVDSGQPYYLNEIDGTTSWHLPVIPNDEIDDFDSTLQHNALSTQPPPLSSVGDDTTNSHIHDMNTVHDERIQNDNERTIIADPSSYTYDETVVDTFSNPEDETTTPLPDGWIVVIDEASGQPYYLNEKDGTTSWERPLKMIEHEILTSNEIKTTQAQEQPILPPTDDTSFLPMDANGPNDEVFQSDVNESEPPKTTLEAIEGHDKVTSATLPYGWIELFDEDSGARYYLNEIDGMTSWDPPENVIIDSAIDTRQQSVNCDVAIETPSIDDTTIQMIQNDLYMQNDQGDTQAQIPLQSLEKIDANHWTETTDDNDELNINRWGEEREGYGRNFNSIVADDGNNQDDVADDDDDRYNYVSVLPPGWKEVFDDVSGKPYYFSEIDGTIMWARPTMNNVESEMVIVTDPPSTMLSNLRQTKLLDGDVVNQEQETGSDTVPSPIGSPNVEAHLDALPPGWSELIDEANGMKYYVHQQDGITTWDHPTAQSVTLPTADIDEKLKEQYINNTSSDQAKCMAPEDVANNDAEDIVEGVEPTQVLPQGWVKLYDESGNAFYFNEKDDIVSWDSPQNEISAQTTQFKVTNSDDVVDEDQYSPEEAIERLGTNGETVQNNLAKAKANANDVVETAARREHSNDTLPPGWATVIDDGTGEEYYYCELNGRTSWERPIMVDQGNDPLHGDDEQVLKLGTNNDTVDDYNSAPETTGQAEDNCLPTGWQERVDADTGQLYYYNETTGSSMWDFPDDAGNGDVVSAVELDRLPELPDGWVEVRDPSSETIYFFNESLGITTWDRPVESCQNEEDLNVTTKHPVGRPISASASFCFGGRLCHQLKSRNGNHKVMLRRTHMIVTKELLVGIEHNKQNHGIHGPYNNFDEESVRAFAKTKASMDDDLLWCLLLIAADSFGKLRSTAGVSDSTSPEASIIRLLLQNESRDVVSSGKEASFQNPYFNGDISKLNSVENLLLHGKTKEAVDESLSSGNFALALIIARCCDHDVYARAVQRFSEATLPEYMSLCTISLLLSGQLLASGLGLALPWENVTNEILRSSWKNHLAAILSNRTEEWNQLALSLGDNLVDIGEVAAAHFCYMVGGSSVGSVASKSKMVLLGCDFGPWDMVLSSDESINAFDRTEAYEWAKRRGNAQATIQSLQPLKVVYAMLLADYGFVDTAVRYVDSIFRCVGINRDEIEPTTPYGVPLSCSMLVSNQDGVLDYLSRFDQRLNGSIPVDWKTDFAETNENDVDVSFVTARTHYQDALGETDVIKKFDERLANENRTPSVSQFQSTVTRPLRSIDERNSGVDLLLSTDAASEFSDPVVEMSRQKSKDISVGSSINGGRILTNTMVEEMPEKNVVKSIDVDTSVRPKVETAPMSAPPNLQSSVKTTTPTAAHSSKKKSLFSLGLKDKVTKWLNPDATTADLGDRMEAYYDEKLKVWVFPGEDPVEKAKPIGPPPVSLNAKSDAARENENTNTATLDPLAAMMAPPKRGPSSIPRSRTQNSAIRPSPASMPIMFPLGMDGANTAKTLNNITMFMPPPVPTSHDRTTAVSDVPAEAEES